MKLKLLFLVAITLLVQSKVDADTKDTLSEKIVTTKNGPVQGVLKKSRNPTVDYISFIGLRYASQTPRFEPAKPLTEVWTTPKIANTPGNVCIQAGNVPLQSGNDDCLFINVHVPSSALNKDGSSAKHLPVLFWIHGGGFTFGEGHTYGAEYVMENENVILVSVNYRLGVTGFITLETDTAFTANNGLRDLVVALKWVQDNISAFGGNPEKVTIMGESAGGAAVHFLLMAPSTKGLYHGAILQSGAFSFWAHAQNPKRDAQKLAEILECPNTEDALEIRKCLENVSANKLVEAQFAVNPSWPPNVPLSPFLPTSKEPQHNAFFAGVPSSFFTVNGEKTEYPNKVPVILGTTRDEGSTVCTAYITAIEGLLETLNSDWDKIAPKAFFYESFVPKDKLNQVSEKLRDYYFGKQPITRDNLDGVTKLYTDSWFLLPVIYAAEEMAKSGLNVWPYIFTYYGKNSGTDNAGVKRIPGKVGHAEDIQYVFTHPVFSQPLETPQDGKFSKELVKFWTDFAVNGVPPKQWSDGTQLNWNPVNVDNDSNSNLSILEIESPPVVQNSYDFKSRLAFWRNAIKTAFGKSSDKTEL